MFYVAGRITHRKTAAGHKSFLVLFFKKELLPFSYRSAKGTLSRDASVGREASVFIQPGLFPLASAPRYGHEAND
jgi:hypothetical protein